LALRQSPVLDYFLQSHGAPENPPSYMQIYGFSRKHKVRWLPAPTFGKTARQILVKTHRFSSPL
jgi:hypothetical protein